MMKGNLNCKTLLQQKFMMVAAHVGPAIANLGGDGVEARLDLFFVGLVLELGHVGAMLGVTSNRSRKHDDGTTVRLHAPVVHGANRQFVVGEGDPGIGRIGRRHSRNGRP